MSADPRYPIGKFQTPEVIGPAERAQYIEMIEACPEHFRKAVEGLSPAQIDTPYRDGGWTVRQVLDHVPDSHMNAYRRFKQALTKAKPTIMLYDEGSRALLKGTPIEISLALLDGLHKRWSIFLRGIPEEHWKREFVDPEAGTIALDTYLALYAWHSRHHVAHVTELRKRMGW